MGAKLLVAGIVTGLVLIVFAVGTILLSKQFIHSYVVSSIRLDPSTSLYKAWIKPSTPVYVRFYLYDLKNPFGFQNLGEKPIFVEVGPFVYKETLTKENVSFSADATAISYNLRRQYEFVRKMSAFDDKLYQVTTLNMAPITIINQIRYNRNSMLHNLVNKAFNLSEQSLTIRKSVRELLFGYRDPFLTILNFLDDQLAPCEFEQLFKNKNNSADESYTVDTGAYDYNQIGKVLNFNGQKSLNYWSSSFANMINGTDGSLGRPFLEKNEPIYFFKPDYCRSVKATYKDEIEVEDGVKLYGYTLNEYFFANGSVNLDNKGFCTPVGNCLPAGILNLTNCMNHKPLILSNPHFLYADEKFINNITVQAMSNTKPDIRPNDVNQYNSIMYIEPQTGLPMRGHKRLQMNTQLFRDQRISLTQKLPEILFPLYWVDESFEADKSEMNKFYDEVNLPIKAISYGQYVALGVGSVILAICAVYSTLIYLKYRKFQRINSSSASINDERSRLLSGYN